MRLGPDQAAVFCRSPDLGLSGVLLYGPDEGLVALRRRELVDASMGQGAADAPRRPVRLEASGLRRDPASLEAALRTRGFFSDRPLVVVDGATDAVADAVGPVLADLTSEDGFLIVTAGPLAGRSALRRLFEQARHLVALPIVAGAPTMKAIETRLESLGCLSGVEEAGRERLLALAATMDSACFDRILESVAIYSLGSRGPVTADEIGVLATGGFEAELDAFVDAVAGGRPERVGQTLRRVVAAGSTAVSLALGLQRHFRHMMVAESATGRVPPWGARREVVSAQLRYWRRDRLEQAARLLYETDARLRSADRAPALALVERCALRLAMMAER